MPAVFDADGIHAVGYSNRYPGGYAELMVLNELLAIPVPDGVPAALAAMTEPLAVGVHAVNKSRITDRRRGDRARAAARSGWRVSPSSRCVGIGPVIGADFSSRRRSLAEHLGCDVVVDPRDERVIDVWRRVDGVRPLVIFEAVGVPGMIDAGHADGAQGRPHPRRRRVHAGGSDPPDARHRARAQHPVRARLRAARVRRRRCARSPNGAVDLAPAGHRHGRRSTASRRRSTTSPIPRDTPRSWCKPDRVASRPDRRDRPLV